jgi:P4 family phage/plasmid primase-like protien
MNDFLIKHAVKKGDDVSLRPITNTRIGDKESNIYGGSYHIPDEEYNLFLELYYHDVIKKKKKEYLTEKQRETEGPIAIDVDLRFHYDVDERQYTKDHIDDLIILFLEEIKKIFQFDENSNFQIFQFEKPTVNRIKEKNITKDGIHLLIGIQADRIIQLILREKIIKKIEEIWSGLPLINSWDDVFDKSVSSGSTNWQLFGSRKPNYEQYQLTRIYNISFDTTDNEFVTQEILLSKFDIESNIQKLSVRYKENLYLFMKNNFINEYEEYKRKNRIGGTLSPSTSSSSISATRNIDASNRFDMLNSCDVSIISKIQNMEELDAILNNFLDNIQIGEYELKDAYNYVMILPESYYGEGSFSKWIRVCWVLRNISNKLLIVWVKFSSRAEHFQFSSIPDLIDKWNRSKDDKKNGLTKRSLINWVKYDAKEEYEIVRKSSIDTFVEETIKYRSGKGDDRSGCGDFDLANVLFQMKKDSFVCVSVKSNMWYQFINHRWQEIDSGTTLRKTISIEMRDLYNAKTTDLMNVMTQERNQMIDENGEIAGTSNQDEVNKNRAVAILNISQRLSKTNDKKNIMTEAKELFYDGAFLQKLDTNPYLICFKNGVFDLKEKVFRNGNPEDNISMSTNIDYVKLKPEIHQKIIDEINEFMSKIFPRKELLEYMWDHLASCMIGTCKNQTFNMYIGIGQNGKSVLVNLMEKVLGDYKGDVPLTLVTEKRGKVGGLAPEIVQLKGKRLAVMQEPSKNDKINEGIMKQLTSGKDPIQGRAPYMPTTISFVPQFNLIVTANQFMKVESNDHGTWRRIRAVPFEALFTDNPVSNDPDKPFQFKIDKSIDEKFDSWKEVFASMLIERVCITDGLVKDCSIVMAKSNEYRKSQDYISEFVQECIIYDKNSKGRIQKTELNSEFAIWYNSNYGGKGPSPKDLHEYMDKTFNRNWVGTRIRYNRDNNADEDNTTIGDENDGDNDYVDDIEL